MDNGNDGQNSYDERSGPGTDPPAAPMPSTGSAPAVGGTGDTHPTDGGATGTPGPGGNPDRGGPKSDPSWGTGGMGSHAMHSRSHPDQHHLSM